MSDQRRFLVIVRAGDDSLHERWLEHRERNWDLVVSYEGRHPDRFRRPGVLRDDFKGPKWPALSELLESGRVDWRAYEHVWLAQGDLVADGDDISRMFEICSGLDLWVAHPALTLDSTFDHWITLQNFNFGLRYTNFVEPLAPVFKARFLEMILPLLKLNTSGGGFGHVWTRLVDDASRRCAVIDSVPIQLQRGREGVLRFGNPQRMDVVEDAARLFASMGIDKVSEVNIGALMRTGERYSLFDETADAFLGRMMRSSIGISGDPAVLGQFFVTHERIRLLGPEAVNALPLPGDALGVVDLSSRTAGGLTPADEAAASDARAHESDCIAGSGKQPSEADGAERVQFTATPGLLGPEDLQSLASFVRKDMSAGTNKG